jgi:hypothetical protein
MDWIFLIIHTNTSSIITHSTYNFIAFLLAYLAGTGTGT